MEMLASELGIRALLIVATTIELMAGEDGANDELAKEAASPFAGEWRLPEWHRLDDQPIFGSGMLRVRKDGYDSAYLNFVVRYEEQGVLTISGVGPAEGWVAVDVKGREKWTKDVGRGERDFHRKELWRLIDENTLERRYFGDEEREQERPGVGAPKEGDHVYMLIYKRDK